MQTLPAVRVVGLLGVGMVLAAFFCEPGWSRTPAEDYLHGPQGPYRGKVVDAETRQPIQGALVVVVWLKENVQSGALVDFVAARELLTGPTGEFVVDEPAIETTPPLLARPPRFVIFAHGYTPFPETRTHPAGAPSSLFRGQGTTVPSRPARTEEERIVSFNTFFITISSGLGLGGDLSQYFPGQPRLVLLEQAILREFEHFGFVERGGHLEPKEGLK